MKLKCTNNIKLEMRLAIKLAFISLFIMTLSIGSIIYINGIYIEKSERNKFLEEIFILTKSLKKDIKIDEVDKERNRIYTTYDTFEIANRLFRNTVIVKENGKVIKQGIYEKLQMDPSEMPGAHIITKKEINGTDYLLYKTDISKDWILFTRDINFIKDYQKNLLSISLFWGIGIFIIILFSSYYLAKVSLKPVRKANKKLREYNYHVAHELRTPLAVLKGMIQIARLSGNTKELDDSQKEIEGLEKIINSLLFLGENTIIKESQNIRLIDMIDKIIETHQSQKTFIIKKNTTGVMINTHQVLFERLLNNIIENAIKYSSDNKVTISTYKNYFEVENTIDFTPTKDQVNSIFEPFFKFDRSRSTSGYGLGLSIVKRISEIFGWKVEAISTKNNFVIRVHFK